jgi:type IV secretory pathway VirB6-like protein
MVTYNEYLKNILKQILDSYNMLKEIEDKKEDLNNIKKEMLKINGFLKVVLKKLDSDKITSSNFRIIKSKFQHYLENYYFEKEIETMAPLYSNDLSRVKNMRLKILEALEDREMMEEIEELIKKI